MNIKTTRSATLSQLLNFLRPMNIEDVIKYGEKTFDGFALSTTDVLPGSIFFARKGEKSHGAIHAFAAIEAGAVAIITDVAGFAEVKSRAGENFPILVVENVSMIISDVASWFYDYPARGMEIAGITGTNGKTTITHLIEQLWSLAGRQSGCIGTVGITLGNTQYPAKFTTPESIDLQKLLHEAKKKNIRSLSMEVSSHALAQFRVRGIKYEYTGFSNLTQDHLDFHGDMENYFLTKAKLFTAEYSEKSFINIDDPYGRRLVQLAQNEIHTLSRYRNEAQWHFVTTTQSDRGFEVSIRGEGGILIESYFPLIGDHNLDNLLMAVAIVVTSGVDPLLVAQLIPMLKSVPGRLEKIEEGQDFFALVDYAHTPDAVERTLASLRKNTAGKIIAVLGCGGDRDPGKRPFMGAAVVEGSDIPIFTSDNPRSEDPEKIIQQMKEGITVPEHALTFLSRSDAIKAAVERAHYGDTVVILGKGHESGQIIGNEVIDFDDRNELRKAIINRQNMVAS